MNNYNQTLKKRLQSLADPVFKTFSAKIIPSTEPILGVRTPQLRAIAKEIAHSDDWQPYIANATNDSYEEIALQGMVIGAAKMKLTERLRYVKRFIPKINNWSICDSFCCSLKISTLSPEEQEQVWQFLQPYLHSKHEFALRFGLVMLLDHFVTERYIDNLYPIMDSIRHEGYYVQMAIAWAISICFIKFPEQTMNYLHHNQLNKFTYNKALQKITESYRVTPATKTLIRKLKKKKNEKKKEKS